jgi:uncharacterized protein (DUF1697 family)
MISATDLAASAMANPFPESATERDGKTLHFFFLAHAPSTLALDRLEAVRCQSERWQIRGRVFYLHAPDGVGRSKLAAQIGRILNVRATARNWHTVRALLDLAGHHLP